MDSFFLLVHTRAEQTRCGCATAIPRCEVARENDSVDSVKDRNCLVVPRHQALLDTKAAGPRNSPHVCSLLSAHYSLAVWNERS